MQLFAGYAYLPIYGAPSTPTPTANIATVPPLPTETPTQLPFPIITAVASPTPTSAGQTPFSTATPKPSTADAGNSSATQGGVGSEPGKASAPNSGAGLANSGPRVALTTSLTATKPVTTPIVAMTGTVLAQVLNMRQTPNTQATIVDKLPNGAVVTIVQRAPDNSWLYVCCGPLTKQQGWVSSEFIQLSPAPVQLRPIGLASAVNPSPVPAQSLGSVLTMAMKPTPAFVWQGRNLTLQFVLTNHSTHSLTGLRLRDDLPPELQFVTAEISNAGQLQQEGRAEDGKIFTLFWPTLAAGAEVTATITVQVASNTPNGVFIKNLAVANSQEVGSVIGGVSIVMPPSELPKF